MLMNYEIIGSIFLTQFRKPIAILIKWNLSLILLTSKVKVSIFLVVIIDDLISTEHTSGKEGTQLLKQG